MFTWVLYVIRTVRLLGDSSLGSLDSRRSWVHGLRLNPQSPVVRAEACLALAEAGEINAGNLEAALLNEPRSVAAWYLSAAAFLRGDSSADEADQLDALVAGDPALRWISEGAQ
jgi:hypothetical protein